MSELPEVGHIGPDLEAKFTNFNYMINFVFTHKSR